MSKATDDNSTTNVIAFRARVADAPPTETEMRLLVLEEHCAVMERALADMAHSIKRQRAMIADLKTMNGCDWPEIKRIGPA